MDSGGCRLDIYHFVRKYIAPNLYPNGAKEEGRIKREAQGSQNFERLDGESGRWALNRLKTGELLIWFLGDSGHLCAPMPWDIILGRTEGICFVANCNLKTIFSVCHCCFAESMIEVKFVPGLKTKNKVMSAERTTSKFLN